MGYPSIAITLRFILTSSIAQSADAVEYTDCTSSEW